MIGAPGRIVRLGVESRLLKGNLLGDPHARELPVWLPPEYDEEPERRFPVLFCLAGYMGTGESHLGFRPWGENLPHRLARLQHEGAIGPMLVAFPDAWTRLGGSQYIDSATCGPYMRHLCDELVPLVDGALRTDARRERRGLFGKSSGGFGALVHAMLRPDCWGAVAAHSPDAYFEFCFLSGLPTTLSVVGRAGGVRKFLQAFANRTKHGNDESHAMMHLAMAACFDPQPLHPDGLELPMDLDTGEILAERWDRWLGWDPVRMVHPHREALQRLSLLYLDCGSRDQYHLHFGARQLHARLNSDAVPHVYEEFPDDHSSIDYRFDRSLPLLFDALTKPQRGALRP